MLIDIVKVFAPTALAFGIGIAFTPLLTHYLYKYKVWKKHPGKYAMDGTPAEEFNRIHKSREGKTPRMGGIVVWGSVLITTLTLWFLGTLFRDSIFSELNFLSRSQTWIPLGTLLAGALVGLLNDFYDVTHHGNGLRLRMRLLIVTLVAAFVGWWFYEKLGISSIGIPFDGAIDIGFFFVPFFIFVTLSLYSSGVIDGIDGLSGGIFAIIFSAYAGVAFYQQQIDLAAFSATVAGATLAFLWFNIPPARFWMTETGTMGLTMTLAVVVFMTDTLGGGIGVLALLIIGLPLVLTVLSNVVQILSKKILGKKVFRVAPLHHHFEAIGWPNYKVTMRYWVFSLVSAIVGITFAISA